MPRRAAVFVLLAFALATMPAQAEPTVPGVTDDEITVVFYNDLGIDGDMNAPYDADEDDPPNRLVGAAPYQYANLVRTMKAHARSLRARFQTYGRTVRIWAAASAGGVSSPCAARQGDAAMLLQEHRPFAVATFGSDMSCLFTELARAGVLSFSLHGDVSHGLSEAYAPYIWSLTPAIETEAAATAAFICSSLAGRQARFAADATLAQRPRRFGLISPVHSVRGPTLERQAELLHAELIERCNLSVEHVQYNAASGTTPSGAREALTIMARFQTQNITTVICYCIPVMPEQTVLVMQKAATSRGYSPEWLWDGGSAMDRSIWHRTTAGVEQRSFGVSPRWRMPAFTQSAAYRSFKSAEPDAEPNARFNYSIYYSLLPLFTALEAAGPDPSADTVRAGLSALDQIDPSDPFAPAGAWGDPDTPYSWIDSSMAWWWDPLGQEPGSTVPTGCIRVAREGARFTPDPWPAGDDWLFTEDAPCTGPPDEIYHL